ncbi:unnamed protein product, partial [Dovyalis caffra]
MTLVEAKSIKDKMKEKIKHLKAEVIKIMSNLAKEKKKRKEVENKMREVDVELQI